MDGLADWFLPAEAQDGPFPLAPSLKGGRRRGGYRMN